MHHPTDRITHTTAFVTPVVEHWLEQEIAQFVPGITVTVYDTRASQVLAFYHLVLYERQMNAYLSTVISASGV